jgi:hypothetical protein
MSAHLSPLTAYRDRFADWVSQGRSFGDIEDVIDEADDLTTDQKAALWLFAFSLRDPAVQQLDARAHLAAVQ